MRGIVYEIPFILSLYFSYGRFNVITKKRAYRTISDTPALLGIFKLFFCSFHCTFIQSRITVGTVQNCISTRVSISCYTVVPFGNSSSKGIIFCAVTQQTNIYRLNAAGYIYFGYTVASGQIRKLRYSFRKSNALQSKARIVKRYRNRYICRQTYFRNIFSAVYLFTRGFLA